MYKITACEYSVKGSFGRELTFALLSDLHSKETTQVREILDALERHKPDYILMPGDIFERLDGSHALAKKAGFELMRASAGIAPTFYSFGNHENGGIRSWNKLKWCTIKSIPKYYDADELRQITECSVTILDDGYTVRDGIAFGGLSSGLINEGRRPDTEWLDDFCREECPKVLLCHHPEYYPEYLREKNIDLIASGHAHGGQWRIFGRGVFAPGQGLFPKYTSGVYDQRLVVSRGLKASGTIPRIFNSPEIVFVKVT